MIQAIDQTLLGIGMRNVVLRLIILPDVRIGRAGVCEFEIAVFAGHNIKTFLTYGVILAGKKVLEIFASANGAITYLM
jgi:hypothetical protein